MDGRGRFENHLLAVADGLFNEFDHLPVGVVMRAISAARRELRETEPSTSVPDPEAIGMRARELIRAWTPSEAAS